MVKLKLLINDDARCVYQYQPEGEGEFGEIELKKDTGEFMLLRLAEKDNPNGNLYKGQTQSAMTLFYKNNSYPDECQRYWG